ncbi:hypothetical protein ACFO5X_25700 [Seohaeicola nanhaiensis]|uniref:Holliday junction resolvase n=1 Tax=Seohaeicola nanhaiensis TaxID=1387282 RepID=A0ABV9KQA1_9RHOB
MPRSFKTQLAGQIGEGLVVAELGRRGIVATSFTGNVPDIDILAYRDGRTIALQVKALRSGSVSFDARRFMQIDFDGDRQIVTEQAAKQGEGLIYVFVGIGDVLGYDEFYLIQDHQLRELIHDGHISWLAKHGGIRPRNPQSTHIGLSLAKLEAYRDNWALVENALTEPQT